MVHVLNPAVALWEAPLWATSELVDYGSIEHRTCIGEIAPAEPEAPFVVDVVQRDELDLNAEPIAITRTLAHVSVAGVWLRSDQARDLARLLNSAADIIEDQKSEASAAVADPATAARPPRTGPPARANRPTQRRPAAPGAHADGPPPPGRPTEAEVGTGDRPVEQFGQFGLGTGGSAAHHRRPRFDQFGRDVLGVGR